MTRKDVARTLVQYKAVKDVLAEMESEVRAQAKTEYEGGDADTIRDGDTEYGRVRMDRGRAGWQVVDWAALGKFVKQHTPDALVVTEAINPAWLKQVCKTGEVEVIDPDTGEVQTLAVDGLGQTRTADRLVVTTTDQAEDAARRLLRGIAGEVEQ